MSIQLKKSAYEKLIKQLIFVEENKENIAQLLWNSELFESRSDIQKYLKYYVRKVETILKDITIADTSDFSIGSNSLPFIVIGSYFTLIKGDQNYYCHLCSDVFEQAPGTSYNIYAFSESGLELLMKKKQDLCDVDLGDGFDEYTLHSIWMY